MDTMYEGEEEPENPEPKRYIRNRYGPSVRVGTAHVNTRIAGESPGSEHMNIPAMRSPVPAFRIAGVHHPYAPTGPRISQVIRVIRSVAGPPVEGLIQNPSEVKRLVSGGGPGVNRST